MTEEEIITFKNEVIAFVKKVYSLILDDYKGILSEDSLNIIDNFNYEEDIVIDEGGKFSNAPGRWESKTNKIHLSPELFNEVTYKKGMEVDVDFLPLEPILEKMKNCDNESFSGTEIANLVRQQNLSYLDITKGVVIHEIFHSIIHMKTDELFTINHDGTMYDCRGVKGEYLDEGLVEYYARKFAVKHNLFIFPSVPYQSNVDFAKLIVQKLGKHADRLVFNGNYKTVINYIHEPDFLETYHINENDWLKVRIFDRLKIAENKEENNVEFLDFIDTEELKLA